MPRLRVLAVLRVSTAYLKMNGTEVFTTLTSVFKLEQDARLFKSKDKKV